MAESDWVDVEGDEWVDAPSEKPAETPRAPAQFPSSRAEAVRSLKWATPEEAAARRTKILTGPALPIGGAILGSLLAPAAVPAAGLGAGIMAGAQAAGLSGLGAAGGEGWRQLFARRAGIEAPSAEQAAKQIAKTGAVTGALEGGTRAGLGLGGKLFGTAANVFTRRGAESIKEGIKRPESFKLGSQETVDRMGVAALGKVQNLARMARRKLGEAVNAAADKLHFMTRGQKVVDLTPAADAAEKALVEAMSNPITGKAVDRGEAKLVQEFITKIRKNPLQDIKTARSSRQALDNLTEFERGGVPRVSSDAAQRALKGMSSAIRDSMAKVAESVGDTGFLGANRAFSKFAEVYDDMLKPVIGTRTRNPIEMTQRLGRLAEVYNRGGVPKQTLESLGQIIPGAESANQRLLTAVRSRAFTGEPIPTVSGAALNVIRMLGGPQALGATIKAGVPVARTIPRAAAGAGPLFVERENK